MLNNMTQQQKEFEKLKEAIQACGDKFSVVCENIPGEWTATTTDLFFAHGSTRLEAVNNLRKVLNGNLPTLYEESTHKRNISMDVSI